MSHFLPIMCMFLNAPAGRMESDGEPHATRSLPTIELYDPIEHNQPSLNTYLAEVGASAGIFTPDLGSSVLAYETGLFKSSWKFINFAIFGICSLKFD